MFCARCGVSNAESGKFCVSCGAPLQAQQPPIAPAAPIVSAVPPLGAGPVKTDGKAIASLICGICFLIFPAAVAAIIVGHLSLAEIGRSAGRLAGRGMATAGLVLGYFGVVGLIPFVLIIAAIAIPNLLRARMAANEASAVGSLRTINTAAITYSSEYGNGFPPSLITMDGVESGSASCDHAQLIGVMLASGQRSGYVFTYVALPAVEGKQAPISAQAASNGCTVGGAIAYAVTAVPITRGTTGQRSFFTDQTGVIRFETSDTTTADSPPLGE